MEFPKEAQAATTFVVVGAVIGVGKLLASDEKLTWRIVIARTILSGGLGLAAAAVVVIIPSISFMGQVGIAAAMSSLGTTALESVFRKVTRTSDTDAGSEYY